MVHIFISVTTLFAFLYTDPGTGALMWQLLCASIVGGLFYARTLIGRIKKLTSRKYKKE
jgi:hypothetical protein